MLIGLDARTDQPWRRDSFRLRQTLGLDLRCFRQTQRTNLFGFGTAFSLAGSGIVEAGKSIAFHQVHEPSGQRVRYEKVVPGIGPVDRDQILNRLRGIFGDGGGPLPPTDPACPNPCPC